MPLVVGLEGGDKGINSEIMEIAEFNYNLPAQLSICVTPSNPTTRSANI